MSRTQREIARLRRLLAIAVHRQGGEMVVTPEELAAPWELGMDNFEKPTVITGFPGRKSDG